MKTIKTKKSYMVNGLSSTPEEVNIFSLKATDHYGNVEDYIFSIDKDGVVDKGTLKNGWRPKRFFETIEEAMDWKREMEIGRSEQIKGMIRRLERELLELKSEILNKTDHEQQDV